MRREFNRTFSRILRPYTCVVLVLPPDRRSDLRQKEALLNAPFSAVMEQERRLSMQDDILITPSPDLTRMLANRRYVIRDCHCVNSNVHCE